MARLRGQTDLFALAERARQQDDVAHGAVGAAGYGFALANQIESQRFHVMGGLLAGLPDITAAEIDTARVITLTSGVVTISSVHDELFSLTLFCSAPGGAQDRLSFFYGAPGLALGDGGQLRMGRSLPPGGSEWQAALARLGKVGSALAAAWQQALAKVTPASFELTVTGDFGRSRFGWPAPIKGKPRKWSPSFPGADPADLRGALAAAKTVDAKDGAAACRAVEQIEAARDLLTEKARPPFEREYQATCKRLWMAAVDHLEREMRAARGFDLPREVDLLARVLPFRGPVTRERSQALFELSEATAARRWAAHPWRF